MRIDRLPAVHQLLAPLIDDAFDVGHPDVVRLGAERDQEIEAGERRGARPGGDDLHRVEPLAAQAQRVLHGGGDDDRGAVLVVMEHRDLHARLEPRFDLEALRRLDVLEIDAAERRLERGDDLDHALDLLGRDLDVEHVDAGEFLEQDRLALHHRLAGERADVAEPEHGGAVADHGDEVGPRGELGGLAGVRRDRLAGRGDARRIREREIALIGERLGRRDLEFSRGRPAVIGERAFAQFLGQVRHGAPPWRAGPI